MNKSKMLRRLRLSGQAAGDIKKAVKEAELHTTGEIAIAVTSESARYSAYELLFAVVAGAFLFAVLLPFAAPIKDFLDKLAWGAETWYLPAFYGIICFGLIALLFLTANVPAVDRLIIPKRVRALAVYNRALRYFIESGVYATRNRSGILIFVSYMEREVRILADTGISAEIPRETWNSIASDLAEGLGTEDAAASFVRAVERCGEILARHFPADGNPASNPDELPDGMVVLEDEIWL